jgi:hypothetical protein
MSYSGIYGICFNCASTVLESIDHHVMQMFHCGYSVLCVSHFRLCGTVLEDKSSLWLLHPWVYKYLMRMAESASSRIPAQTILM